MADTITAPINPREPAGFLTLLKEIVVHKSITLSRGDEIRVDETDFEDESFTALGQGHGVERTLLDKSRPSPVKTNLPRVNPQAIFAGAFLETYEPDGYNLTTNEVTSKDGIAEVDVDGKPITLKVLPYEGKINVWHAIFTFLGVPTRFSTFVPPTDANVTARHIPAMGGAKVLTNFIGGWYPTTKKVMVKDAVSGVETEQTVRDFGERNIWQIVFMVIPVKILIGVWNIATLPIKFALNIVKLFTEFLPTVILNGTGLLLNWSTSKFQKFWAAEAKGFEYVLKGVFLLALSVFTLVLGIPHYVARIWALVGRAATSPEKSARLAFDFGNSLEITEHENVEKVLRKVFAITAATLSVALTIALWAVALPFAIAAIVKFVPQVMVAVNAVASSSLIAPTMGYVNGALQVISGFLSIFNPAVVALSTFVGVTVTPAILAVGATLAAFAGLVSTIGGRLALEFRNWWALRPSNSGPIHFFANLFTSKKAKDQGQPSPEPEIEVVDLNTLTQIQVLISQKNLGGARALALTQSNPGLYLVEVDPTAADNALRYGDFKPVVTMPRPAATVATANNSNNVEPKPRAVVEALVLKKLWAENKGEEAWERANQLGQPFKEAFYREGTNDEGHPVWFEKEELIAIANKADNGPFEAAVANIRL